MRPLKAKKLGFFIKSWIFFESLDQIFWKLVLLLSVPWLNSTSNLAIRHFFFQKLLISQAVNWCGFSHVLDCVCCDNLSCQTITGSENDFACVWLEYFDLACCSKIEKKYHVLNDWVPIVFVETKYHDTGGPHYWES